VFITATRQNRIAAVINLVQHKTEDSPYVGAVHRLSVSPVLVDPAAQGSLRITGLDGLK